MQKVRKLSCLGSLLIPAFWPFAEGLLFFYKFIVGKEGF
jgi:hypothetical protein